MIESGARCLAFANGAYVQLGRLDRAVPDAEEFASVLATRHQYHCTVFSDLGRADLQDATDQHLGPDVLVNGSLIVAWIGHGQLGPDSTLRLIGRSKDRDVELAKAADLGEWAARTGARQVLVVVDTCFSGAALVDAVRLADAVNGGRASAGQTWFGIIAASLKDEPSRSGTLVRELIRILTEGPRQPDFRWDRRRPWIRGDDLQQALVADWTEPRHRPHVISIGPGWDLVRNPRYEAGTAEGPVDHLLRAARGGSGEENFFTGREAAIAEIVSWMGRRTPGLFVLTGPPGCGKSAVAGRMVSLSFPAERERLQASGPIPPELDPGPHCVDAQLHARGVTVDSASEDLARQLGLDPSLGSFGVLGEARRRRKEGRPFLIVIDGLDEARGFSSGLAMELIAPLAREAAVLVATRGVAVGGKPLIEQLGPATRVFDLGQDPEGTRRDVQAYVVRRLRGVAPIMDPDRVAAEIAGTDGPTAPQFLLARLITSQLRDRPVDTSSEGWRLALATSVETALEQDLQSVVLTIAGKPHPTAARELIAALALAHGAGFPADDVWPAVATAISPSGTCFTREDAYAVLGALGRHLVAGSEGDQPVFRIAHQRLVDYVVGARSSGGPAVAGSGTAVAVGSAVLGVYERLLDSGLGPRAHAYLWRHAWRHLAHAGDEGLAGLRRLVQRDREAFLPDLASGLELAASEALSAGQATQAVAFVEEAIRARRELDDKRRLALALFIAAWIHAASGDQAAGDAAALEASQLAREAAGSPESRRFLGGVLVARATLQLMEGHGRTASMLAREAAALYEGEGAPDPRETWSDRATAWALLGRAASLRGDLAEAESACQRAVELVDTLGSEASASVLRDEILSVLARIQYLRALTPGLSADGPVLSAVGPAAIRLREEYRRTGPVRGIGDIPVARGLIQFVLGRILDAARGLGGPEVEDPWPLVDDAVGLVEPYAGQILDAAFVLADGMILRVQRTSPSAGLADLAVAERHLRRAAASNPAGAFQLGLVLDAEAGLRLAQWREGTPVDVAAAIARQKEAVALIRRGPSGLTEAPLAMALNRFVLLLGAGGEVGGSQVEVACAEAIPLLRGLLPRYPDVRLPLAALLSDQTARRLRDRPVEACDLAREAVDEAGKLPQPNYAGLLGIAETNLGGTLLTLGQAAEAAGFLRRAVERLEPLADLPVIAGALANACVNLAQVELLGGNPAAALPLADRSVSLFGRADLPPVAVANRPLAQLALGWAQRAGGMVERGSAVLRGAIEDFLAAVRQDVNALGVLVYALNNAAPDLWDEVLGRFADRPDIRRLLDLQRWVADGEESVTVGKLLAALEAVPPAEVRVVHTIARQHRFRRPGPFEAAWTAATGAVPGWLRIDPAHELRVVAWLNAGSWVLSRDYLASHPVLLRPDTDVVLDEVAEAGGNPDLANRHRDLLARARTLGVAEAYAPLLVLVEAVRWMESDDPESYLAEHPELTRPAVAEVLREWAGRGDGDCAVFASLLDLVRRGESALAFQAFGTPDSLSDHLRAAWRSKDVSRLEALATIIHLRTRDDDTARRATVGLAMARVLLDQPESADSWIRRVRENSAASERDALIALVGDAIEHHPARAADLARLIEGLRGT